MNRTQNKLAEALRALLAEVNALGWGDSLETADVDGALAEHDGGARRKVCFATGGPNPFKGAPRGAALIELTQRGRDSFAVRYGLQVKTGLDYAAAALELGACIMHAAACDGLLDNRERGSA